MNAGKRNVLIRSLRLRHLAALAMVVASVGMLANLASRAAGEQTEVAAVPVQPMPGFTAEREAAALTFVRKHHPELASLLATLKDNDPTAYQKAIQDLFRTSERLAQIQERNPARYKVDLRSWQLRSRIELLAARLSMVDDPQLRRELRNAFVEQLEVEHELLRMERDRLRERLRVLDAALDRHPQQIADEIDQRLDRALKRIGRAPAKKPAGKETAAKTAKPEKSDKPDMTGKSEKSAKSDKPAADEASSKPAQRTTKKPAEEAPSKPAEKKPRPQQPKP